MGRCWRSGAVRPLTRRRYSVAPRRVCPPLFAAPVDQRTLTLLPVGDPGNAVDPHPGAHLGAVPYRFYVDKYDVTNAQYVELLNAKASVADPFGLYDTRMADDFYQGGITRSASAPYAYAVKPNYANKPVVNVSWYDGIRYTNWLTNGQGNNGAGNSHSGITFDYANAVLTPGLSWQESISSAGGGEALRLAVRFPDDADGNNVVDFADLVFCSTTATKPARSPKATSTSPAPSTSPTWAYCSTNTICRRLWRPPRPPSPSPALLP